MLSFNGGAYICIALCISFFARISVGVRGGDSALSQKLIRSGVEGNRAQIIVGSTFASRYQLMNIMKRPPTQGKEPVGSAESAASQGSKVSERLVARFGKSIHRLGRGSFGEAWRALDTITQQHVVIKFFVGTVEGVEQYLSWDLAAKDRRHLHYLESSENECKNAIEMQFFRHVSLADRQAASHIMKCLVDHVKRPVSTTGHAVAGSDIVYHIFEYAGENNLEEWMNKALRNESASQYVDRSLRLFKQLLQVLHYFSSHARKWVHHDLKPANIVVRNGVDGLDHLTVIDLGSATVVSEVNANRSLVTTLEYAPFEGFDLNEWVQRQGMARTRGYDFKHFSSFDIFSAGVILDEMLTGYLLLYKLTDALITKPEQDEIEQIYQSCDAGPRSSFDICKRLTLFYMAGRPGGFAQRFLSNFSEDVLATSPRDYHQISAEFQHRARKTSWYAIFKRMIAYAPVDRATPSEVLASELLRNVELQRSKLPLLIKDITG